MNVAPTARHLLITPPRTITRGLYRLTRRLGHTARTLPAERRAPALLLAAALIVAAVLAPYGPYAAIGAVLIAAAWTGREHPDPDQNAAAAENPPGQPAGAHDQRLAALYTALVPYFAHPDDPHPLYHHDGDPQAAFPHHSLDAEGRLAELEIRYPPYFRDTDPDARSRIETVIHSKTGHRREYRYTWQPELDTLHLAALPPLSTELTAQRFVTTRGEIVLGFTDAETTHRTIPVHTLGDPEATHHAPPVVWRTGPRSTEAHLLALGTPGSGTTTLLRSIALQALQHGDEIIVVDGACTGEFAHLTGRPGILAVETTLTGTRSTLDWLGSETIRRRTAINNAKQEGQAPPPDASRHLWLLLDHPSALAQLAAEDTDPLRLLDVPLRHGRAAHLTVVVAEEPAHLDQLPPTLLAGTRARVLLGATDPRSARTVLGASLPYSTHHPTPPGRGYARLGDGQVHRLQVPATPDPLDEDAPDAARRAVSGLLTGVATPPAAAAAPQPSDAPATRRLTPGTAPTS